MKKIVFMGAPEYAAIILEQLIGNVAIALVVTQPDKPVGRRQILTPPPVKVAAEKAGLAVRQPEKLDAIADEIAALAPDLIVVAAYGQILSERVLTIAPCLNLHASLLPKYRGAAPIEAALLRGDRLSGLTLMRMERGLDTGAMIGWTLIDLAEHDARTLAIALASHGAKLLLAAFARESAVRAIAQNHAESSLVRKVKKSDAIVDFNRDARAVENATRAFADRGGAQLASGLKILKAHAFDTSARGEIGSIALVCRGGAGHDGYVNVYCKGGIVEINIVQPVGKNAMKATDYINGKRLAIGNQFI